MPLTPMLLSSMHNTCISPVAGADVPTLGRHTNACTVLLLLPMQVYTPEQATRAAKAAVAQLQLIEQRVAATANPLALPKTQETDLSRERRL